jgi:hypothetical protein
MKRFILVDPSFDGTTGDKWQYAVAFARSARANGFEFVLLAAANSPRLQSIDGVEVDQRPVFADAFYEHERIVTRHLRTGAALAAQRRKAAERRQRQLLEEAVQQAEEEGDSGRRAWQQRRLENWLRQAGRAAGLAEAERLDDPELPVPFNRDDFGCALAKELLTLKLKRGDVLFFHTMTPAMLESFSEVALQREDDECWDVDAYCLFHFGAEAPDARTFLDRYYGFSHVGSLALRLRAAGPFRRLHLLATSEVLRQECEAAFGLPFGVFHGLTNLQDHLRACGGPAEAERRALAKRDRLAEQGQLRVVVRAGDLDEPVARALGWAHARLAEFGLQLDLRVTFHAASLHRVREVLEWLGDTPATLVDAQNNDTYIVELADANLALLSYPPDRYRKRVSAVLHDCAVLGTSCVVPAHTTLSDSSAVADVWVYSRVEEIGPVILQAARSLPTEGADAREQGMQQARALYAADVVQGVIGATAVPSLEVARRGPVAAFFMPAWGRCGSSYAMEGQVRYLLKRGFFVVQVLVMDKPVDLRRSIPYFWRLLLENSQLMRGCVQRVAHFGASDLVALESEAAYSDAPAFDQYLQRIAMASVHCEAARSAMQQARVAVVNHVFHSRLARRLVNCPQILETHDIQSYQMQAWPLRRVGDDTAEPLARLLEREMAELAGFDHVINVAPNEHRVLGMANPRSSLITPYVVFEAPPGDACAPTSVTELAVRWNLSQWYHGVQSFDLLLLGDSHKANLESCEWFIREVYLPHLHPQGRSLAIAGRVTDPLYKTFGTIGNVFYMGFVPDVRAVRAVSSVAVLPDIRGTGISIKTLETFAAGQAFVATSRALRGFADRLPPGLAAFDKPEAFAGRVERLLHDSEERAREAQRARQAYELIASEQAFMTAWDEVLDAINVSA